MRHSKRNHGTNIATLPYLRGPDCCPHGLFAFVWRISKTYPCKLSCEKAQKSTLLLKHNPFLSYQHRWLWTNNIFENKHLQLFTSCVVISLCDQQGLFTPELLVGMSHCLEIMGCSFSREGRENWWQWVGKQGLDPFLISSLVMNTFHQDSLRISTAFCQSLKKAVKPSQCHGLGKKPKLCQQAEKQQELGETAHIRVDLSCCNIVFQISNTIQPSKEVKFKLLFILWCVTTCSCYCSL